MPKHLDHIALVVKDPKQAAALFESIFDDVEAMPGLHEDDRRVLIGGVRLELVAGTPPSAANGDHLAFAVEAEEFSACARRLRELGREFQMARGDSALYFRDDDNHVYELDVQR